MLNMKSERDIYALHSEGRVDEAIVSLLVPDGRIHEFESFLFDYKGGFHLAKAERNNEKEKFEIIKDIVSFYNSMGGYIFFYHPKTTPVPQVFALLGDLDSLNTQIKSYAGMSIPTRTYTGVCSIDGIECSYCCLFVPKRGEKEKPATFIKNSTNFGTGEKPKFVFAKGDLYVRYEHECRPCNHDIELMSFAFSARTVGFGRLFSTDCENNLPARDPNLIRFVGRKEYLEKLWNWFAVRGDAIKVLTAAGGLGKTTVAYEFASQVLDRPGSSIDKLVWLSGKKITFSAILGKMVPTTRCDFAGVDDFLESVLIQVGYNEEEILRADRGDRIELCIDAFSMFGVLLIVDDVDSLEKDDQNELFSIVSRIVIAANVKNESSRVLFTSRLELLTGASQRIKIEGFSGNDFLEYLNVNVNQLVDDKLIREKVVNNKEKILIASAGSPIFITSIIRLISRGFDLHEAVKTWRGERGEKIRAFAFEREIGQLNESQRAILFAMQLLARATVDEIKGICDLTTAEVDDNLSALKEYHLYSTKGDPAAGTVLEVPEPIRLMHDITASKLPNKRRIDIERACARIRNNEDDPARVIGVTVAQTVRLWKQQNYDVAIRYLDGKLSQHPQTGEFYSLRARTAMSIRSYDIKKIQDDFVLAEKYGSNVFDLIKYWSILKIRNKDWRGMIELLTRREESESYPIFNCAQVYAYMAIADASRERGHSKEARDYCMNALLRGFSFISRDLVMGYYHQLRSLLVNAARTIMQINRGNSPNVSPKDSFDLLVLCVDNNFAPTIVVQEGLTALTTWLASRYKERRIPNSEAIHYQDQVNKIKRYLDIQQKPRKILIRQCQMLEDELAK